MTRSRRKTPIAGVTVAASEKRDKQDYNRRYRRIVKQAVTAGDQDTPLPHLREHSDPSRMDKDGKRLLGGEDLPAMLRK